MPRATKTTPSIDALFKFIPNPSEPKKVIDAMLDDEDFLDRVFDVVTATLQAQVSESFDVQALRKAVDGIDDACQIEMAALKVGFLLGAAYGKRNANGVRDDAALGKLKP